VQHEDSSNNVDPDRKEQLEAVQRWYNDDWKNLDKKLQSSVVEGISVFLSLFDDNPRVKRLFCPPVELYRQSEVQTSGRKPLPQIATLLEQGKVIALNFPVSMNPGLARAIGVMLKMDFQRAVLNRIPHIANNPSEEWRPILFVCDEYHELATVGVNEPSGDEKFSHSLGKPDVFLSSQRRASAPCNPLCPERPGERSCKPSARRSSCPCQTNSRQRLRANSAARKKNGTSTTTSPKVATIQG